MLTYAGEEPTTVDVLAVARVRRFRRGHITARSMPRFLAPRRQTYTSGVPRASSQDRPLTIGRGLLVPSFRDSRRRMPVSRFISRYLESSTSTMRHAKGNPDTRRVPVPDDRGHRRHPVPELSLGGVLLYDPLALAISTPGIPIATQLARMLQCYHDILPVVDISVNDGGGPLHGAVTLDGEPVFSERIDAAAIPFSSIHRVTRRAHEQVRQWYRTVRGERPIPRLEHRSIVLTDECLGAGYRMAAAVRFAQHAGAHDVTVAVSTGLGAEAAGVDMPADRVVVLGTGPRRTSGNSADSRSVLFSQPGAAADR